MAQAAHAKKPNTESNGPTESHRGARSRALENASASALAAV